MNFKLSENEFIVGIDIGNSTSSISYFNFNSEKPELIDVSGGYGKINTPTVVQYIKDTKEWVFGEYALLNKPLSNEITFDNIVENLGKDIHYIIDNKPVSLVEILSLFIIELIGNIKNINPNAHIIGLNISAPCYISEKAKNELVQAVKAAGFENELISVLPDRECIIQKLFYENGIEKEKILIIDFGGREVRGGIYNLKTKDNDIFADCIVSYFNSNFSVEKIELDVYNILKNYYCENTGVNDVQGFQKAQLEAFAYQHKDLIFQNKSEKDIKLYFNFSYPPFKQVLTKSMINKIIQPYASEFVQFIDNLLNTAQGNNEVIKKDDINTVLCWGGGFEMLWARELVINYFGNKVLLCNNPKGESSIGACYAAAAQLNVLNTSFVHMKDLNQLDFDIGLIVEEKKGVEKFVPIVPRNSFWWQKFKNCRVILMEDTEKSVSIDFFKRDLSGHIKLIEKFKLNDFPKRPKAVTMLDISLKCINNNTICASIKDSGFGEIFPKSSYEKIINISI